MALTRTFVNFGGATVEEGEGLERDIERFHRESAARNGNSLAPMTKTYNVREAREAASADDDELLRAIDFSIGGEQYQKFAFAFDPKAEFDADD